MTLIEEHYTFSHFRRCGHTAIVQCAWFRHSRFIDLTVLCFGLLLAYIYIYISHRRSKQLLMVTSPVGVEGSRIPNLSKEGTCRV